MTTNKTKQEEDDCTKVLKPVKDALDVLDGKWKIQIIISLNYGKKRFMEISREVKGISDKMLSKELKELEMHRLLKRTVYDAFPPVVEYDLTEHGKSLRKLVNALRDWGELHRKVVLGK